VFRLDDITPGQNERKFERVMALLLKAGIQPLLGLVPDNQDPKLQVQEPSGDLWASIRKMVAQGQVDIAQHGYQHLLYKTDQGILNRRYFLSSLSEFAGRPYEQQYEMIRQGQFLLRERGLITKTWMAPNHSFDHNTLDALRELGFTRITDGIGLYPYRCQGLLFVPQQFWRPRNMPFGIWTVCLHTNAMSDYEIDELQRMLPYISTFSFQEAERHVMMSGLGLSANWSFSKIYSILQALKKCLRSQQ
jgi:predicted deacetylase